jgi:hypothetical protein
MESIWVGENCTASYNITCLTDQNCDPSAALQNQIYLPPDLKLNLNDVTVLNCLQMPAFNC